MLWQLVALFVFFFWFPLCRWVHNVSTIWSAGWRSGGFHLFQDTHQVLEDRPLSGGGGGGCNIYVGRGNSSICPLVAIENILAVRGPVQGPLFCYADGCPLKWQLFLTVQSILPSLGCSGSYSGHNFCNGTATKATTQESMITLSRL